MRETKPPKEYFDLKVESLQALGKWSADCAERALSIYENTEKDDNRPRQAINCIKDFSISGKRTNELRKVAMAAYKASLETKNPAASAAAKSASLAAASAYTHPFRDIRQAEHIIGPAAYSALSIELSNNGDEKIGDKEIEWAIADVNNEIVNLLKEMPQRKNGKKRIEQLLYSLDIGIRKKYITFTNIRELY